MTKFTAFTILLTLGLLYHQSYTQQNRNTFTSPETLVTDSPARPARFENSLSHHNVIRQREAEEMYGYAKVTSFIKLANKYREVEYSGIVVIRRV